MADSSRGRTEGSTEVRKTNILESRLLVLDVHGHWTVSLLTTTPPITVFLQEVMQKQSGVKRNKLGFQNQDGNRRALRLISMSFTLIRSSSSFQKEWIRTSSDFKQLASWFRGQRGHQHSAVN